MLSVNTFFILAPSTFFYFSQFSPNKSPTLPFFGRVGLYWESQ